MSENPFEVFELDPRLGPEAITERFRELADDATPEARARIREAWQELTLHPMRRLRAALGAHPETRVPIGVPPAMPRLREAAQAVTLAELLILPSVEAVLGEGDPELPPVPLGGDPILKGAAG